MTRVKVSTSVLQALADFLADDELGFGNTIKVNQFQELGPVGTPGVSITWREFVFNYENISGVIGILCAVEHVNVPGGQKAALELAEDVREKLEYLSQYGNTFKNISIRPVGFVNRESAFLEVEVEGDLNIVKKLPTLHFAEVVCEVKATQDAI